MNFTKMLNSRKSKNSRNNKTKSMQYGGVGFRPDVFTGCKIGGLPVINPTSDCPTGVGPKGKLYPQLLYGSGKHNNVKKGGGRSKRTKRATKQRTKRATKQRTKRRNTKPRSTC